MKKFVNDVDALLSESLRGFGAAHGDLVRVNHDPAFVTRADAPVKGKVALISGGGSGHEPMHSGFVGYGMLHAACVGPIFTSPTRSQILTAAHKVHDKDGILFIVKNHLGDKANFWPAIAELQANGIKVGVVVTNDDVGIPNTPSSNCRGTGVTVLLEKIVGSFVEEETDVSLEQVVALAERVNKNGRSAGVAFTSCIHP